MLAHAWAAWSSAAAAAVLATTVLAGSSLVGFSLLPRRTRRWSGRVVVPLAVSAGWLAVGWSVWVVGTLVGTTAGTFAACALAVQALRVAPAFARRLRELGRHLWRLAAASPVLAVLTLATAGAAVLQAALPVVDSDGLRYHLALPKLYLLEGKITFYPHDVVGGFPQTAEMLYLLVLRLDSAESAKWLHLMLFLGSLAVLAGAVHGGRRSRGPALLAALAFAATPVALAQAGAAFVDHVALFHVAVAAFLLIRKRAAWAGLPLAAAAVTKVTVWPAVLVIGGAALVAAGRGRRLRAAGAVLLPAVLAWLPFGLRNTVATGDPWYPVGLGLLGKPIPGLAEGALRYATQFNAGVGGFLGIAWGETLAARGDEIAGWHHLVGLLALLVAVKVRQARWLAGVIVAYGVLGLWFHPPTRYLLPAMWALAACEGMAVARLPGRVWVRAAALLCVPSAIVACTVVATTFGPWKYLGGALDREAFLAATVPAYRAARLASREAGAGKIMALDFPAPFYLDRPWIAEGILLDPPLRAWLREVRSGAEILERLRAETVSVVIVTPGYGGGTVRSLLPLAADAREGRLVADLRRRLERVATVDGVDVYRVPNP
ncbi:MAG TPA: hypothetical protein P5234_08735 [Thermoanaerobaculaceae bacterium]|nr:hypothetical protein [Thermoanaerobaculaceae bacterium]HRS16317.1 hypothetical protein [Thermoanaerobaculaceae bacterium]